MAHAGNALPTGGHYVEGSGAIAANGDTLSVTQAGQTGIIDWHSFSIGTGHTVAIDNGAGATLNRVTGADLSRIDGLLSATGSTYLINRNGIVIGPGGKVVTGGSFVGSTRDITNEDFLNGGADRFSGSGDGDVVNQGTIRAKGGDAVLIGRNVSNSGSVDAPKGTAAMAAGNDVVLQPVGGDRRIYIQGASGDGDVTNDGAVKAAQAELAAAQGNVYALAGNTDGVVRATGSETKDGRVLLTAGGGVSVSGKVEAASAGGSGGGVTVTAKTVDISGSVDASAKAAGKNGGTIIAKASGKGSYSGTLKARGGEGGEGGFVETSGHEVDFTGLQVDTSAENGKTGEWLIDPEDLTVDATAAATISNNLASSDVALQTTDTTANGPGTTTPGGAGDITIAAPVSWSSGNMLTLHSYNSIFIDEAITSSSGTLRLKAGRAITTGADGTVDVGKFVLYKGNWKQIGASLPTFNAVDFRLDSDNSKFVRALGGDGTSSAPYQLFDVYGLQGMDTMTEQNYVLSNDIDASGAASWNGGKGFDPIGNFATGIFFRGSLNGQGHAISDLVIDRPGQDAVGLFSGIETNNNMVSDFNLVGGSVSGGGNVGALAGELVADVKNIHSSVDVHGAGDYIGGLVGNAYNSNFKNTSTSGNVSAPNGTNVGGLAGYSLGGDFSDSYATGNVTGKTNVGGLVGKGISYTYTYSSYATGDVTATGASGIAGGLAGKISGTSYNSYFAGTVTGSMVGAIAGAGGSGYVTIHHGYWDADKTGPIDAIGNGSLNSSSDAQGLTSEEMKDPASFAGWSISSTGGSSTTWRIYPGQTAPLLRWALTPVTVTADGVSKTYDGTPYGGSYTYTTSIPGLSLQGTLGDNLSSVNDAGSYAIGGFFSSQSGYDISYASGTLTIDPASLTVTAKDDSKVYDGTAYSGGNGVTYSGFAPGDDASDLSGTIAYGGTAQGAVNAGDYTITASGLTSSNYNIAFAPGTLSITAPPTNPISGTVYSSYGGSTLSGANVIEAHLGGGAVIDQTTSDGSGAYSVTSPTSNGKLLLFLDNSGGTYATTLVDYQGSALTGIDLYGGNLNVANVSASDMSSVLSILSGFSAPTGSYASDDFLFDVSGGTATPTAGLIVNAPGDFTLDRALNFSGYDGLTLIADGDLTIADAPSLDSGTLTLTATGGGDVAINDAINAPNSQLNLSVEGTATTGTGGGIDVYSFQLVNGTWSQTGESLPSFSAYNFQFAPSKATFLRASGGDGSAATPYLISDVYGLQGMASRSLLSKNFDLAADIDASGTANWNGGKGFLPIGDDRHPFARSFNGHDHAISGLTINRPNEDYVGLFGDAEGSGHSISNLRLAGGSVTGHGTVGALVGYANMDISNVRSSVSVYGFGTIVGGLMGGADSSVQNAYVNADVYAPSSDIVGGVAGFQGTTFNKVFFTGDVTGHGKVGGLIGDGGMDLYDVYASGTVTAQGRAGGLIGRNESLLYGMRRAYFSGTVSGSRVGAIAGDTLDGTLIGKVFWDAEKSGLANAFGNGSNPAGVVGLTSAQMKDPSSFGWSMATEGGSSATWRIYPGETAPLLRWALTPVTVTSTDISKTYDGAAFSGPFSYTASIPGASLLGTLGSNLAGITDAGTYAIGGLYSDQYGYDISFASTATINPRPISVTAANLSRVYGAANPPLTWRLSGGLVGTDKLSGALATTATAASDAGYYDITQGTLAADANYALSFNAGLLTVDPKTLTLILGYQTSKTYDGNTDATLTLSNYFGLGDVLSGDTVSLSNYTSGSYDNRNAGSSKTVTVSGLALSGPDAGNYQLASDTLSANIGTISRKALLPGLTGSVSKTYDGTADATLTLANYTGLDFISGDDVALSGYANGAYLDKNVGSHKPVGVSGLSLTGRDSGNYRLISPSALGSGIGAISPAPLTVTAKDDSKVYDGTAYSGGNGVTYSGFAGSDDASDLSGSIAYGGTAQGAVNVGGYTLTVSGLSSSNYDISFEPGTLTISAAALDLSITPQAASKIYGDTLSLTQFDASGLAGTDAISGVTLTSPGTAASADAGSYDIAVSNAVFSSGSASNYDIHYHTLTGGLTVTPRSITVTADDLSRIYGAANPSLTWQLTNGSLVNGDTLSGALATAATTTSDVGDYAIAQGTLDAGGNYALSFNSGTLTIDRKTLTLGLTGTVDKTYDGTADATLALANYSGLGFLSGDTVALSGYANGSYTDKNAGSGKKVSVSGLSLSGTDAGNYELASTSVSGNVGVIDPKSLTVTARNDRVTYDGTTYSGGNGITYAGFVGGENETDLNGTIVYGGTAQGAHDAGTYEITASGLSSANYDIAYAPGTLVIDPKTLTPSLTGSVSTTYDGTADATLALANYTGLGFVTGDSVALSGYANGSYADKNAGTGKKVSVSGLALTGTDAGNYTLASSSISDTIGIIDRKTLTPGLNGTVVKTYDGNADATLALTNFTGLGFVAGDNVSLSGYAAGAFADKNVGAGKRVSVSGLSLSGRDAGNYRLASTSLSADIGAIDPATLTITPEDVDKTAGQSIVLSGYRVNGLAPGDVVTGVALASPGAESSAAAGSYVITASNATGTGLSNYGIAYLPGTLTVRRSIPADESVRAITSHPFRMAWQSSQSEIGPGAGTGGFWSLPLVVRTGFSRALDTADLVTGSIEGGNDDDPWNLLLGRPGRLNGRSSINVRLPRIYRHGGMLSANLRQGR